MKPILFPVLLGLLFASCNSQQSEAKKQAEQIQKATKSGLPGAIETSEGGYMMKAKLRGEWWVASSMMPPELAGRIIGYSGEEWIGLPYDRRYMVVGKKIKFGEDNATDLATDDEIGIWGGRQGEMEITKVGDKWAEGTFYFTGSTSRSDKTMEVTEGTFRISLDDKP